MEANPGTFDQANFAGYFDAGINRLSIGAQSFSEQALKALGRIHNTHDIHSAVNGLQQVGFKRFNLDIMHGLPGQSHAAALDDLDAAINLGATHISWYQLTIEPNTVFYNRPPALPDENILMNIAEKGASFLSRAGFEQYEISAWSKPGHQARHNLNYWKFGDYIGIGAGAHGKLTRLEGIYRTTRTRLPKDYLAGGRTSEKQVPNEELLLEYLMNTLRLTAGFTFEEFTRYTGFPTRRLDHFIERATGQGLIVANEKGLRPTNRGQQFLNNLLMLVD